jgi:chromosome segregation ATPase
MVTFEDYPPNDDTVVDNTPIQAKDTVLLFLDTKISALQRQISDFDKAPNLSLLQEERDDLTKYMHATINRIKELNDHNKLLHEFISQNLKAQQELKQDLLGLQITPEDISTDASNNSSMAISIEQYLKRLADERLKVADKIKINKLQIDLDLHSVDRAEQDLDILDKTLGDIKRNRNSIQTQLHDFVEQREQLIAAHNDIEKLAQEIAFKRSEHGQISAALALDLNDCKCRCDNFEDVLELGQKTHAELLSRREKTRAELDSAKARRLT